MSATDYPEFERPLDDEHIAELEAERDEHERLHDEHLDRCWECEAAALWLTDLPGVLDAPVISAVERSHLAGDQKGNGPLDRPGVPLNREEAA